MKRASMRKKTPFRVDDRVARNKAVGSAAGTVDQRGDVIGTILKVTDVLSSPGGTRARVRVRWDTGHVGSVDDRQIVLVSRGTS